MEAAQKWAMLALAYKQIAAELVSHKREEQEYLLYMNPVQGEADELVME